MKLLEADDVLIPGRTPVRYRRFSGVWRPRIVLVTLLGLAATLLMLAVNVGLGEYRIGVLDVLRVLLGGGDPGQQFVVLDLRLPRSLTAVFVGAALGLSGAITQTVTRNALASPDILGITTGASTTAVAVIVLGGSFPLATWLWGTGSLPFAALVGGLLTALVIYALAWRKGVEGNRLILVGVGVGAVAAALTSWLLVIADLNDASKATIWLTGSLNGRDWAQVWPVAATVAVLLPVALALSFGLGAMQLGDDAAGGLGMRVDRQRTLALLVAVTAAAVATASAGPIDFVALVVPQVAMRLVASARPPLLTSAVFGALLLLGSDVVARTVLPTELPVGTVTAALGAPYLMWLLTYGHRRARV
ncbi:ABC-type transporter, integral membrane subunit [Pseudonocardia dioxanivorans CB1190]|uniref:ABC-type transporter, integral membrane subunit n=1 Tax=Pseudonocardia dioxanivorans (strain ATCC 55486 / DSM 44775 / JCM 13855 / CB1190) TaxID=675635 RepID=F4CM34_PSEUX|nr:iron chelate uptake ABC transporter family permease subunit [Pseudonocardia dioxanivorans]AEA22521.1 ABC-type transporter, integral membrane subunit [Pseudonocardia dioxanivorans CB1190]